MIVHIAIVYRGFGKYEAVPFLDENEFSKYMDGNKDVVGANPITVPDSPLVDCPDCGGDGLGYHTLDMIADPCEFCNGTGKVTLLDEQNWLAGNGGRDA